MNHFISIHRDNVVDTETAQFAEVKHYRSEEALMRNTEEFNKKVVEDWLKISPYNEKHDEIVLTDEYDREYLIIRRIR